MSETLGPAAYVSLALVILLVLSVNLLLLKALRKKDTPSEIDLIRKAGSRLKQPWKPEDDQLEALSKMVKRIKESDPSDSSPGKLNG